MSRVNNTLQRQDFDYFDLTGLLDVKHRAVSVHASDGGQAVPVIHGAFGDRNAFEVGRSTANGSMTTDSEDAVASVRESNAKNGKATDCIGEERRRRRREGALLVPTYESRDYV